MKNNFTIDDAMHELLEFFVRNDVFDINKDLKEIRKISADTHLDRAIVRKALSLMEERKLLYSVDVNLWVLKMPLQSWEQNVTFSGEQICYIYRVMQDLAASYKIDNFVPIYSNHFLILQISCF